jgi:putative flippase GtrA
MNLQFSYFLISGGVASLLNWISRFFFSQFFDFQTSVVLAFFVGLLSGFFLMRLLVFKRPQNSVKSQVLRYIGVNMFALPQTFLVSVLVLSLMESVTRANYFTEAVAHAAGIVAPVFTSYFGHKYFTFR